MWWFEALSMATNGMAPRGAYTGLNVHVMGECICNSGWPNKKGATCAMCE